MSSPKKSEPAPQIRLVNENEDLSYERSILAHTVAGLPCPLITVTGCANKKYPIKRRKVIVVTA